jgi:hypothetical protein
MTTKKHEVPEELLSGLLANYKKPEDLIGEKGLPKQLTKNRGSFPSDEALLELFFLALRNISLKWSIPIHDCKAALTRFTIEFGDRLSDI